jgi:hypothetical protein
MNVVVPREFYVKMVQGGDEKRLEIAGIGFYLIGE